MSNADVIRAWKDDAYRMSLSPEERAALPANPAGVAAESGVKLSADGDTLDEITCGFCCTMTMPTQLDATAAEGVRV